MENHVKKRQSGIELLRVCTMLGVIILHYNDGRAFVYVSEGGLNQYILYFLESICICAVDLFVLISGYFLCTTEKRSLGKVVELFVQVIFYKGIWYILMSGLGYTEFSVKLLIRAIIPNNYFVMLYSALYVISPYINIVLKNLNRSMKKKLLITMLLLFSVYPILADAVEEILETEIMGLSTVGAWGSQSGYTIVNFILMYLIGAYIRLENIRLRKRNSVLIGLLMVCGIFGWSIANEYTLVHGIRSAWCYHNPFVIALAVVLFLCFKEMNFYSKWINELAKAAFTCFLIQGLFLDYVNIESAVSSSWWKMLLHIGIVAIGIYLASYVIYKIYDWMMRKLMSYLTIVVDKIDISIHE